MQKVKLTDTVVNPLEANRVGIPHRTAAMGREAVAVDINNVDVRSPQRIAFLQNTCTFVHQTVEATIRDFGGRDLSLHHTGFFDPLANEFANGRIRSCAPLAAVFVPARSGFLTVTAEFTKAVFDERLANAGHFEVTIFFANAPTHIESGKVAGGEGPHGHAEIGESLVDGFDARAFFDQELRFAAIRAKHAIANKTPAVADEHSDLAKCFSELHARGDHFL